MINAPLTTALALEIVLELAEASAIDPSKVKDDQWALKELCLLQREAIEKVHYYLIHYVNEF